MNRQVTIQYLNDENERVYLRPVLSEDQIARLLVFVNALEEEEDASSSN